MKNKIVLLLISVFFISCSTKKEILYFQNPENLESLEKLKNFEPIFEVNDVLHIKVSSMNPEVATPFQMNAGVQTQGGGGQRNSSLIGYMVDVDGYIQFPVLGKISVAGKSRSELEAFLTKEIRNYVTDAVIAVRLLNFRVVVLGETGESVINVENEQITIPELLAQAGGITYDGKRDNILVIREIDGVKSYGRVDMTTSKVFENPYYYLKQNDIVYVEPTYRTVKSAGFITSYTGLISLATTIFGIVVLISR